MRWVWDRLCGRAWFWPRAAWSAARWVGDLATHPVTAVLSLLVIILGFGGLVLVVHPDILVVFWAVVFVLILLLGKGARLMWEQDRVPRTVTPAGGQTIENVETMHVTNNHNYYSGLPPSVPSSGQEPPATAGSD